MNILSNEELIGSAYVQGMMVYRVNNVDGITAIFLQDNCSQKIRGKTYNLANLGFKANQ